MELKGKRIGFLGDSITQGVGASCGDNNYVNVFARNTGAEVFNFGVSGTRIARHENPNDGFKEYFQLRAERMPKELDAVVVFGGTNDYGHGSALMGSMDDRTVNTFYGALHSLFRYLLETYPKAQILVLTPLHRGNETVPCGKGSKLDNAPLETYVNAERQVAQYYSLPVLDLFAVSGIQPDIDIIKKLYLTDGLHPSDLGHAKLAHLVEKALLAL